MLGSLTTDTAGSSNFNDFTRPMSVRFHYSGIPSTGGRHQPQSQGEVHSCQTRTTLLRDDNSCPHYRVLEYDGGRDTAGADGCYREGASVLRTQQNSLHG